MTAPKRGLTGGLPRVTGSMSAVYCLQRDRRQMLHVCGFHLGHTDTAPTEAKRLLGLVAGGKDPTRVTPGEGFGAVMERYLAPSRTRDEAAIVYRNRSPSSPAREATPPLGAI
jgi:hypothetical protein